MSLMIDDAPFPRKCSRCGSSIESFEHYHTGHGWDVFCDTCENSFNQWMKNGKQKRNKNSDPKGGLKKK